MKNRTDDNIAADIIKAVRKIPEIKDCKGVIHISRLMSSMSVSSKGGVKKLNIQISLPAEEVLVTHDSVPMKSDDWEYHPILMYVKFAKKKGE